MGLDGMDDGAQPNRIESKRTVLTYDRSSTTYFWIRNGHTYVPNNYSVPSLHAAVHTFFFLRRRRRRRRRLILVVIFFVFHGTTTIIIVVVVRSLSCSASYDHYFVLPYYYYYYYYCYYYYYHSFWTCKYPGIAVVVVVEFDPLYYSFRFYFPSCSFSSFLSFSSCYWYYYSHHHCLVRLIFTKNRNNRDHPTRFRLQYRPDRSVSLSCHTGSCCLSLCVVLVLVLVLGPIIQVGWLNGLVPRGISEE